jgi:hypothetical protein
LAARRSPWLTKRTTERCSFAGLRIHTPTLPPSPPCYLPTSPLSALPSLPPRPLSLLRYHIRLSNIHAPSSLFRILRARRKSSFAFAAALALAAAAPLLARPRPRALIRPRALLHRIYRTAPPISTASTASLSDFTCAGYCFDLGCLCLVVV